MAPRTRSRLLRLVIVIAVIAAIREWSIRQHEGDLHDWPRPNDPSTNGAGSSV